MVTYRTFRNTDPPHLVSLWRSHAGQPGLMQPVSVDTLEQLIFAKLYFDYRGLVLAYEGERLLGFAHAGFGPNSEQTAVSPSTGTTCIVMTGTDAPHAEVASELVERCESYLGECGAKVLYGGGIAPVNPFYCGLYGGSQLPGILDSDTLARETFATRGYEEVERTVVLYRDLNGFEAPIDRQQMQVRRQMVVEVVGDAPTRTWWEACTLGAFDLTRFALVPRSGGQPVATATFRSMEPSGAVAIGRSAGLVDLAVDPAYRRRGLATFLVSEAFRQFLRQGIVHVEVQAGETNGEALGMFRKVGFQQTAQGGLWRKA